MALAHKKSFDKEDTKKAELKELFCSMKKPACKKTLKIMNKQSSLTKGSGIVKNNEHEKGAKSVVFGEHLDRRKLWTTLAVTTTKNTNAKGGKINWP